MNTKTPTLRVLLSLALTPLSGALAAIPIAPAAGTWIYAQDFDGLYAPEAAGNVVSPVPWADDLTIPGWWFHYTSNSAATLQGLFAGAAFSYSGADGSVNPTLSLTSQGTVFNSDRAMATPSTTARCEQSGIVVFQNAGARPVELKRLRYNGEVLRTNTTSGVVETVFPYYRIGATEAEVLTMTTIVQSQAQAAVRFPASVSTIPTAGNFLTGWTDIPTARFTFSSPLAATATSVSQPIDSGTLNGVRLEPGQFMAVRFSNINDNGTDALLGIDDLVMDFVEPSATVTPVVSGVVRDTNGTPTIPGDDKIDFVLTVTGTGDISPSGWVISSPAAFARSGPYNQPVSFTGIPISEFAAAGHGVTAEVADASSPTSTGSFTVTAPWCQLTGSATGFTYNDRGTGNTSDDSVAYQVSAAGQFTGPAFILSGDGSPVETPYSGSAAMNVNAGSTQQLTLTDSADPACFTTLTVNAPGPMGFVAIGGPDRVLPSLPDFTPGRAWIFDTFFQGLTQNASTQQIDHTVLSEVIDLSGTGVVTVTAELAAVTGTSSGFEAADHFRLDLIVDGGPPVSMLGAADIDGNGQLDGASSGDSELPNAGQPNATRRFAFSADVPSGALSLQVRVIGNTNSASETLLLTNLRVGAPIPTLVLSDPTNVVRHENGPGVLDDSVTFDLVLTGRNAGTSWTSDTTNLSPASGPYGTTSFTLAGPLPTLIPAMIGFRDATEPSATATLTLDVPPRAELGIMRDASIVTVVGASLTEPQSTVWRNDPVFHSTFLSAGTQAIESVTSEVLDLTNIGEVRFHAKLTARETSVTSNFETIDRFKAELLINAGLPTETTVNLIAPYDLGDGASGEGGAPNGPPDGWLNGYLAGEASNYNDFLARDEFNINELPAEEMITAEFNLAATIPAGAFSVQLRLQSQGVAGSETLTFEEVVFDVIQPIFPGHQTAALQPGVSWKISAAALAGLGAGGRGPLSVPSVQSAVTGRGASVLLEDGLVIYQPPPGLTGLDSFTYTLTDGVESVTGTVTIFISLRMNQTENIVGIVPEAGGNRLAAMGIPGRRYQWESSEDLNTWNLLGDPLACPNSGLMTLLDPGPLPPTRYYRLAEAPAPAR